MNNAYKWVRLQLAAASVFLVGTQKQASEVVALEAARCGGSYVNQRWAVCSPTDHHESSYRSP